MGKEETRKNLKPFAKGHDPRRNVTGDQKKSITALLKELGESKRIDFNIAITGNDGTVREQKGVIESNGEKETINKLIAVKLLSKAINGDLKAISEVLDRTEGKPKQAIELEGFTDGKLSVGYDNNDQDNDEE